MRPILLLIVFWFASGWFFAWSVSLPELLPLQGWQIGLLNTVIGLMLLAAITRTERGRRLFYEEREFDEDGDLAIACLWFIPALLIVWAVFIWGVNLIADWFFN